MTLAPASVTPASLATISVTLCVHTSTKSPWLYLLRDGAVIGTCTDSERDPTAGQTLGQLTAKMLEEAGATPTDISRIMVDIGPGRLSAVRAGVSFANALGFSLQCPLLAVLSSDALGLQAAEATGLPVLIAHRSAAGASYVARYEGARRTALRYGPLGETLAAVAKGMNEAAVIGLPSEQLDALPFRAVDGGADVISPETFALIEQRTPEITPYAPVQPITEQSELIDA